MSHFLCNNPVKYQARSPVEANVPFREYTPRDASRWVEFLNLVRDAPITLEQFEDREKTSRAEDFRVRLVLEEAETPIAVGQLSHSPYVPADHLSTLIIVAEDARRRGIGSQVIERLRLEATRHGYRGLVCELRETEIEALKWVHHRGFRNHVLRFESELDLTEVDPAKHLELMERLERRGIVLSSLDEEENDWDGVLSFFRDRVAESPDLKNLPVWELERCRAILQTNPNGRADWIVLARKDGVLLGISVMQRLGAVTYVYFVGVCRDARNLGIATALLSDLARRAAADGYRLLKIDNMDSNISALRVNEHLGFVRMPGRIELRCRIDA